jgi:hypothetical protein
MQRLAAVFSVTPAEIIARPAAEGMRRVRVMSAIRAGEWSDRQSEWPDEKRYDVMIPDDPALRGLQLYAAEIVGPAMNLRYSDGTILVFSRVNGGAELKEGRHFHVRLTRASDGKIAECVRTLVQQDGQWWLKPESSHPDFQEWIPLTGAQALTLELVGRVRYAVQRED